MTNEEFSELKVGEIIRGIGELNKGDFYMIQDVLGSVDSRVLAISPVTHVNNPAYWERTCAKPPMDRPFLTEQQKRENALACRMDTLKHALWDRDKQNAALTEKLDRLLKFMEKLA